MSGKTEHQTEGGIESAIREIIADNARLSAQLKGCNVHTLPPREERASRFLDCERNGAHVHLERFATEAKRIPRGEISGELLDSLQADSAELLFNIEDRFEDPGVAAAVTKALNTEERFVNFLKGISGAGENLTQALCEQRIDSLLGALKTDFREILATIAAFERRQPACKPKRKAVPHSRLRKYSAREEGEILAFVERPDFDSGRERAGSPCYDVTRAALAWTRLNHPRNMPHTADEFKRAYRAIRDKRNRAKRVPED